MKNTILGIDSSDLSRVTGGCGGGDCKSQQQNCNNTTVINNNYYRRPRGGGGGGFNVEVATGGASQQMA
jgi:hypothetical protein